MAESLRIWLASTFDLYEPVPDRDGLFRGRIHPPQQSRLVQQMSWWAVGTGLLGISHGKTLMGLCVLLGAMIAYAYWQNPTFGWRRNLDMAWIQILLWWHLIAARTSPVSELYYSITFAGVLCYGAAWMFAWKGLTWPALFMHMLLTACANLSLTVLYSYDLPAA